MFIAKGLQRATDRADIIPYRCVDSTNIVFYAFGEVHRLIIDENVAHDPLSAGQGCTWIKLAYIPYDPVVLATGCRIVCRYGRLPTVRYQHGVGSQRSQVVAIQVV